IKVGYWSWLPLKQLAAARRHWHALAPGVTGFEHWLTIPQWQLRLRVMFYRKHVRHESPKNFQLDLFTPDDGHFEYYAVATNMALSLPHPDSLGSVHESWSPLCRLCYLGIGVGRPAGRFSCG